MTNLKIFNETNNIYAGVNTPQFSQLEQLADITNTSGCQLLNLGLFGEAATGKTTSVEILAKACNYELLVINAVSIKSESQFHEYLFDYFVAKYGYARYAGSAHAKTPKIIILIDEAHALKDSVQTFFLSSLQSHGLLSTTEPCSIITENITWIFATTDSSKLIYPLTTRLHTIIFDQYSVDDITNIIKLHYTNIEEPALNILARCSKLVPRTAIRLAGLLTSNYPKQTITEEQTTIFAKRFLNMETNGIDSLDKRILTYLSSYKRQVAPVDVIALNGFTKIKEMLETKGVNSLTPQEHREYNRATFQTIMLNEKMKVAEPLPKSRQDISLALRILDLNDLETRLSYLEELSFIEKTPRGVVIAKDYR